MNVESISELRDDVTPIISQALDQGSDTVEHGTTLPPAAYTSQAFFDLEREAIFKKEWLCVGHVSQIPKVGDYFTLSLFEEPLIVVRTKEGIRALSNVCRHRWAPVAQGEGNTKAFVCPFHKWSYALDGKLLGAPLMDQAKDFDKSNCKLPTIRSEVVEGLGLIFVTFDTTISSISDRLSGLVARAKEEGWTMADQVVVSSLDQENKYNWKVQVETYVECYHHIGGHEMTLGKLLPAHETSCENDKGYWTICNVRVTSDMDSLRPEEKLAAESFAPGANPGDVVGQIVLVYPFTLLTFMKGEEGADIRVLVPVDPETTWSRILATRDQQTRDRPDFEEWLKEYMQTADMINKEDNDINDMQQFGVTSAYAEAGRFSHLEACAWHLAQYVRRKLAAQPN